MPSAWGKAWGSAWGAAWGAIEKAKGGDATGGGILQRRRLVQHDATLFLPPQPELPDLPPVAPPRPIRDDVYKQNQPLAPVDTAQAATDFVVNLLANLPALAPEDDGTLVASDASETLGGMEPDTPPAQPVMGQGSGGSRTMQVAAIDGAAIVDVGASAAAQRAARDDEALALIMILLEAV